MLVLKLISNHHSRIRLSKKVISNHILYLHKQKYLQVHPKENEEKVTKIGKIVDHGKVFPQIHRQI